MCSICRYSDTMYREEYTWFCISAGKSDGQPLCHRFESCQNHQGCSIRDTPFFFSLSYIRSLPGKGLAWCGYPPMYYSAILLSRAT